jgi:hypothetical protein
MFCTYQRNKTRRARVTIVGVEKATSITEREKKRVCVCVCARARMRHTATCALYCCTKFFNIISRTARFSEISY